MLAHRPDLGVVAKFSYHDRHFHRYIHVELYVYTIGDFSLAIFLQEVEPDIDCQCSYFECDHSASHLTQHICPYYREVWFIGLDNGPELKTIQD